VDLAEQTANRERAAVFQSAAAVREAFYGDAAAARQDATAALAISNDREVEYGPALALALSGDSLRAQRLAHNLEIRFRRTPPSDSVICRYFAEHSP
jgi:hypothetical protein